MGDYAEDEAKMEHLAVRFKTAETKNEFKKIFEECQAKLRERGSDGTPTKVDAAAPTVVTRAKTSESDDEDHDDEEYDEDDDEDSVMFANECQLYETVEG